MGMDRNYVISCHLQNLSCFFHFFPYCILDDKTCSETHLVLGKVQFVLNDMRRVREKKQGVSFWDKSKTRGNGWCFVEHVSFFFKLELRWWNSFTLQWWTLPRLFFFEILCPTLSPSTRLSWVVVLHTEALFLFGAGDPKKPLFCFMRVILVTVATEWLWDILRCR